MISGHGSKSARKFAAMNLKVCPLCNPVNSNLNVECFVCTWRGEFITDSVTVAQGLSELLDICEQLVSSEMPVAQTSRLPQWICKLKVLATTIHSNAYRYALSYSRSRRLPRS
ncbi:hypothetical protein BH11ARM1_BH11ARM1_15560 [soil metagenome]